MEIILTVLITLGVCAICYAFVGVVRLERKINEVDDLRLELIDHDVEIKRIIQESDRERNEVHNDIYRSLDQQKKDYCNRIEKWVASMDRRFDYLKNDLYKFDKFTDRLYRADCHEIKIIEDFTDLNASSVSDEIVENTEDTMTLLGRYIDESDTPLKKDRLKENLAKLYHEAQDLEL